MLGRIGSGTFSEVFTVSLRETRAEKQTKQTNGVDTAMFRGWYAVTGCMPMGG